jgi:hypothetical protein
MLEGDESGVVLLELLLVDWANTANEIIATNIIRKNRILFIGSLRSETLCGLRWRIEQSRLPQSGAAAEGFETKGSRKELPPLVTAIIVD